MSVVAITISKRKISIASDSITASGWTTTTDSLAKLQQVNDIIIGSAGRSQCASLLFLYACNHSPVENTTRGILEWVSEFVSWVRSKYISNYAPENVYILVYKNKAYYVENWLVDEIKEYAAIGAGRDFALGCLSCGKTAQEAVESACKHSAFCELPVVHFEVELS